MNSPLIPTPVEPAETLAPGTRVGAYVVDTEIGAGTFGTVYAAHHPVIENAVAIKVLHRRYSSEPDMIARFIDEARAASHIDHAGIVKVFDFGRLPDGRRYTVMERLVGRGLDDLLDERGSLPPDEALDILEPLARALAAAHAAGVAHRDVKPGNVFICADGQARLLDFGVAKLLGMPSDAERTATGVPVGTPAYMAPEQCLGAGVGPAVDVYALGVLAFRMLAGRLPFDADSSLMMMASHLNDPPPWLHSVDRRFGRAPGRVLRRMMAKAPERRPAPVEAIAALREALGRSSGRRGAWLLGAAAVVAGGLLLFINLRPTPSAPNAAEAVATSALAPPDATTMAPEALAPPADAAAETAADAAADAGRSPMVAITLVGLPPQATVTADGAPVTPEDGALALPRGTKPVALRIAAPGYRARTVEVVPTDSLRFDVHLDRPPAHGPRPDPHGIDDW